MKMTNMKKRISALALAGVMVFGMGSNVMAGVLVDPTNRDASKSEETVPIWGYIGEDAKVTPDPDPENPPIVTAIDVSIPTQMLWAAFESDKTAGQDNSWDITTANHYVSANKDSVPVAVSIKNVTATEAKVGTLPTEAVITLGMKTSLEAGTPSIKTSDIANLLTTTNTPLVDLEAGDKIKLDFYGTYKDETNGFPTSKIQTKNDMVLKIDVKK